MSDPKPERDVETPPRIRTIPVRYLAAVGLCLYLCVIWYLGWQRIRTALAEAAPVFLVFMMALAFAGLWWRAVKWRYALGPGRQAVGLFFLSKAAGNFSPGRIGELSPLLLHRHRTAKVAAWVVFDRLIEASVTIAFGVIGLAMLDIVHRGWLAALAVLVAVVLAAAFYFVTRRGFFLGLAEHSRAGSLSGRVAQFLAAMSEEMALLGKKTPLILVMTVLAKIVDLVAAILLFMAFGYRIDFALMAAAKCAHALISAIPFTPDVTGVPYAPEAALLIKLGAVPSEVVVVAIGVDVVALNIAFWAAFGLGMTTLKRRQIRFL